MISIDEFAKVEMKVGMVLDAIAVPESEKLIRLVVDFGSEKRVVFTGVKKWYEPEYFLNKRFVFVTNLEPRKMMGEESQGMIMAAIGEEGKPVFLIPETEVQLGAEVR
jgi:methionine--tRNA ligase beta chain